ncbi:MAG: helix-turn-helix domain-containing protein [Candidatus Aenigmarchaeota archaeon]|nr:helix-turn-helix domain-containing protein [Candidatus Aenigmarchaeota archaeon]
MKQLFDIINGTLLGDANIRSKKGKYSCYKLTAKDKNFLKWFELLINEYRITSWISQDNKLSGTYSLGFYIPTCPYPKLNVFENKWYINKECRKFKIVPKDLELNSTVLLHWYLGDGSLIRHRKSNSKVSQIVLSTNNFSKKDVNILIRKLKRLNLNFYPVKYKSGFTRKYCGNAIWSKTQDGTPYRFFKLIGLECPNEIKSCITGRKGRGSKLHYFRDKWPNGEDWLRILSNDNDIGKIIRQRREELRISRDHMNKELKVGKDYIRKIECGMRFPSVERLRKIVNILDLNYNYIFEKMRT